MIKVLKKLLTEVRVKDNSDSKNKKKLLLFLIKEKINKLKLIN